MKRGLRDNLKRRKTMKKHTHLITVAVFAYNLAGCANAPDGYHNLCEDEQALETLDEPGLLGFINDQQNTTYQRLTQECGVRPEAAQIILAHRDANPFDSVQEIEDLRDVGARTIEQLYWCAADFDYLFADELGFMNFMNDQVNTTHSRLDIDCRIRSDSASQIIGYRDGRDGLAMSSDDNLFGNLRELDRVHGVGLWTLERLYACAFNYGYLDVHTPDETIEFVYWLDHLDPELRELIEGELKDWAVSLSDTEVIFQVRFAEVEILLYDDVPVRYQVRFVQTIDPEGGIQVWYVFTLDAEYNVTDVKVYI
jgi:hypothetical protein